MRSFFSFVLLTILFFTGCNNKAQEKKVNLDNPNYKEAVFAGGCFWCMEPPFDDLPGIIETTVGYTGGHVENPTYEAVCSGSTGHTEAIRVIYDSSKVDYETLLWAFWKNIDPTDPYGQFADKGSQYRTAIFYHNELQKELAEKTKKELSKMEKYNSEIVTEILPAETFYPAEEYHQEFYKKNPFRYNGYKKGSGRAGYIEEKWGKETK